MRILGKEVPPYEIEFLTKNEEKRIGLVRGASIKDEWGNTAQSLVMISDITDRKYTDEAMKHIAAIVESSDDAIIGKTLDGIITSWNPSAERIYGYRKQEVIGRPISLLLPPGSSNDIMALLEKIKQGERICHYETIRRKKNGECITVSLTISPIKDETGMIVGASTIARDVTERNSLEQELAVKNRMLDLMADSIFLYDFEGKLVYLNESAYTILGYTREEMMRMNFQNVIALKDHTLFTSQIQKLQETGEQRFELTQISKSGTALPMEIHSWIIDDGEKKLMLHLAHELTMWKKEQENHSKARKKHEEKIKYGSVKSGKQHHHPLK